MDNEGAHKFAFRLPEMLRDLLRLVVRWVDELDFDHAEEMPAAHVEASAEGFRQRHGDAVWRVPFRRGRLADGSRPYLLVLIEFQSTVDRNMARRMRNYANMLRARLARTTAALKGGLPWILPIVIYNGTQRWTADGERSDLAALPSPRAERTLGLFQQRAYELVSLERILNAPGRGLASWPLENRLVATFRLQTTGTPQGLLRCLAQEYANFPGPGNIDTRRMLHAWTRALLADMVGGRRGGEAPLPPFAEMEGLQGAEMTTIGQERLGKWFEDFRAKSLAEGVAQGIEQGLTQANDASAARLRRQAAVKFDEEVADQLAELLAGKATESALDRVGTWLMECASGEELLSKVQAIVPGPS